MLTHPMLNIRIIFTNYDIITYFLNLAFCSEHFISIKHRILATFNINKKFNFDSLCAFKELPINHVYFIPYYDLHASIVLCKNFLANLTQNEYSKTCLNRTLSKPKTCLNQTDFTVLSNKP